MANLPNMDDVMASERERLNGERETLVTQRSELDKQIAGIDGRLGAIHDYQIAINKVLNGGIPSEPAGRTRGPRARDGGGRKAKADEIMALLNGLNDGLTRGEIIDRLHARGDATAEGAISNALTILRKEGKLHQPTKGKHALAPQPAEAA